MADGRVEVEVVVVSVGLLADEDAGVGLVSRVPKGVGPQGPATDVAFSFGAEGEDSAWPAVGLGAAGRVFRRFEGPDVVAASLVRRSR